MNFRNSRFRNSRIYSRIQVLGILDLEILEFLLVFVLGILEFPTMSSHSPFGGSLYGILEFFVMRS